MHKHPLFKYYSLAVLVIVIDQISKLLVHHYMDFGLAGEIKLLGDLFKLHYTLNPGMAFGLQLGSDYGKLMLSLFRVVAMGGLVYYIYYLYKTKAHNGYITCFSLILGGAVGNLIDSVFYGVLLNNAPDGSASPWFHGQVVDMLYIDIWQGVLPDWVPFFGGQWYAFWPIFNVADASIFCSVIVLIAFQNRFLPQENSIND